MKNIHNIVSDMREKFPSNRIIHSQRWVSFELPVLDMIEIRHGSEHIQFEIEINSQENKVIHHTIVNTGVASNVFIEIVTWVMNAF
jgi:hypothetical protein